MALESCKPEAPLLTRASTKAYKLVPPLLHWVGQSADRLSDTKVSFLTQLATQCPGTDPYVRTYDGREVEMLWEDDSSLTISLTDPDR
jgi:hypothetical protein